MEITPKNHYWNPTQIGIVLITMGTGYCKHKHELDETYFNIAKERIYATDRANA